LTSATHEHFLLLSIVREEEIAMLHSGVLLAAGLLIAAPVAAQTSGMPDVAQADTPKPAKPPADAKKDRSQRLICEESEELGTRLRRKRVCRTAAQLAEERRDHRAWAERLQTSRSCSAKGC
jgi:hypothetical protein